ncbi:unnamed protein product, partial [Amoebophrya sp. A120]|eukprot:GSA120T00007165001.1
MRRRSVLGRNESEIEISVFAIGDVKDAVFYLDENMIQNHRSLPGHRSFLLLYFADDHGFLDHKIK